MSVIITKNYISAISNNDFCIAHNKKMRYPNYSARFRRLLAESTMPQASQLELAKRLKCSQPTINYWLNGEKLPSMDTAIKIAETFKCNVEWLLTGNGDIYKSTQENLDLSAFSEEQKKLLKMLAEQFLSTNKAQKTEEQQKSYTVHEASAGYKKPPGY